MECFKINPLKSNKGSTLILVLVLIGAMTLTAFAVAHRTADISKAQSRSLASLTADNITQTLSTVLSNPDVCKFGFDGVAGGSAGLEFLDASGNAAELTPNSTEKQDIRVPGLYGANVGSDIPNTNLKLNRIYISKSEVDPNDAAAQILTVMADIQPTDASAPGLSPRKVMRLKVKTAGTSVTDCNIYTSGNTNQDMCEDLGCTYSTRGGTGHCSCDLKSITCPIGSYVQKVSNGVPECSTNIIQKGCLAPNSYVVAFDAAGNPICATIGKCPSASNRYGAGGLTPVPGCKCTNATDFWYAPANSCVPPGVCGGANGGSFADAAAATSANLCAVGMAIPAPLTGSGPWSWTCNGTPCSAGQAATPTPAPTPTSTPTPTPTNGTPTPTPAPTPAAPPWLSWNGVCYYTSGGCTPPSSCSAAIREESNPTACESGSGNPNGVPGAWWPPVGVNCYGTKVSQSGCYNNYNYVCTDGRTYTGSFYSCSNPPTHDSNGININSFPTAICLEPGSCFFL